MDVQRSLLIGAIVVLGFMLLTEWTAFTAEKSAEEASQVSRLIETPVNAGDDNTSDDVRFAVAIAGFGQQVFSTTSPYAFG